MLRQMFQHDDTLTERVNTHDSVKERNVLLSKIFIIYELSAAVNCNQRVEDCSLAAENSQIINILNQRTSHSIITNPGFTSSTFRHDSGGHFGVNLLVFHMQT